MSGEDTMRLVRLTLAARGDLNASITRFESAVMRDDPEEQERIRAEAHAHLDSTLDLAGQAVSASQESVIGKLHGG